MTELLKLKIREPNSGVVREIEVQREINIEGLKKIILPIFGAVGGDLSVMTRKLKNEEKLSELYESMIIHEDSVIIFDITEHHTFDFSHINNLDRNSLEKYHPEIIINRRSEDSQAQKEEDNKNQQQEEHLNSVEYLLREEDTPSGDSIELNGLGNPLNNTNTVNFFPLMSLIPPVPTEDELFPMDKSLSEPILIKIIRHTKDIKNQQSESENVTPLFTDTGDGANIQLEELGIGKNISFRIDDEIRNSDQPKLSNKTNLLSILDDIMAIGIPSVGVYIISTFNFHKFLLTKNETSFFKTLGSDSSVIHLQDRFGSPQLFLSKLIDPTDQSIESSESEQAKKTEKEDGMKNPQITNVKLRRVKDREFLFIWLSDHSVSIHEIFDDRFSEYSANETFFVTKLIKELSSVKILEVSSSGYLAIIFRRKVPNLPNLPCIFQLYHFPATEKLNIKVLGASNKTSEPVILSFPFSREFHKVFGHRDAHWGDEESQFHPFDCLCVISFCFVSHSIFSVCSTNNFGVNEQHSQQQQRKRRKEEEEENLLCFSTFEGDLYIFDLKKHIFIKRYSVSSYHVPKNLKNRNEDEVYSPFVISNMKYLQPNYLSVTLHTLKETKKTSDPKTSDEKNEEEEKKENTKNERNRINRGFKSHVRDEELEKNYVENYGIIRMFISSSKRRLFEDTQFYDSCNLEILEELSSSSSDPLSIISTTSLYLKSWKNLLFCSFERWYRFEDNRVDEDHLVKMRIPSSYVNIHSFQFNKTNSKTNYSFRKYDQSERNVESTHHKRSNTVKKEVINIKEEEEKEENTIIFDFNVDNAEDETTAKEEEEQFKTGKQYRYSFYDFRIKILNDRIQYKDHDDFSRFTSDFGIIGFSVDYSLRIPISGYPISPTLVLLTNDFEFLFYRIYQYEDTLEERKSNFGRRSSQSMQRRRTNNRRMRDHNPRMNVECNNNGLFRKYEEMEEYRSREEFQKYFSHWKYLHDHQIDPSQNVFKVNDPTHLYGITKKMSSSVSNLDDDDDNNSEISKNDNIDEQKKKDQKKKKKRERKVENNFVRSKNDEFVFHSLEHFKPYNDSCFGNGLSIDEIRYFKFYCYENLVQESSSSSSSEPSTSKKHGISVMMNAKMIQKQKAILYSPEINQNENEYHQPGQFILIDDNYTNEMKIAGFKEVGNTFFRTSQIRKAMLEYKRVLLLNNPYLLMNYYFLNDHLKSLCHLNLSVPISENDDESEEEEEKSKKMKTENEIIEMRKKEKKFCKEVMRKMYLQKDLFEDENTSKTRKSPESKQKEKKESERMLLIRSILEDFDDDLFLDFIPSSPITPKNETKEEQNEEEENEGEDDEEEEEELYRNELKTIVKDMNEVVFSNLSTCYFKKRELKNSFEFIKKAVKLNPNSEKLFIKFSKVYFSMFEKYSEKKKNSNVKKEEVEGEEEEESGEEKLMYYRNEILCHFRYFEDRCLDDFQENEQIGRIYIQIKKEYVDRLSRRDRLMYIDSLQDIMLQVYNAKKKTDGSPSTQQDPMKIYNATIEYEDLCMDVFEAVKIIFKQSFCSRMNHDFYSRKRRFIRKKKKSEEGGGVENLEKDEQKDEGPKDEECLLTVHAEKLGEYNRVEEGSAVQKLEKCDQKHEKSFMIDQSEKLVEYNQVKGERTELAALIGQMMMKDFRTSKRLCQFITENMDLKSPILEHLEFTGNERRRRIIMLKYEMIFSLTMTGDNMGEEELVGHYKQLEDFDDRSSYLYREDYILDFFVTFVQSIFTSLIDERWLTTRVVTGGGLRSKVEVSGFRGSGLDSENHIFGKDYDDHVLTEMAKKWIDLSSSRRVLLNIGTDLPGFAVSAFWVDCLTGAKERGKSFFVGNDGLVICSFTDYVWNLFIHEEDYRNSLAKSAEPLYNIYLIMKMVSSQEIKTHSSSTQLKKMFKFFVHPRLSGMSCLKEPPYTEYLESGKFHPKDIYDHEMVLKKLALKILCEVYLTNPVIVKKLHKGWRNELKTTCRNCGKKRRNKKKEKKFKRCSRCGRFFYCSRECQSKHWARSHKVKCHHKSNRVSIPNIHFDEEKSGNERTLILEGKKWMFCEEFGFMMMEYLIKKKKWKCMETNNFEDEKVKQHLKLTKDLVNEFLETL